MVDSASELGTILGVWAHPDDESYLMAGLMADAITGGRRAVCVTATRGESGSQDQARWPPSEMAKVREAELMASLDILGVKEHHWLDYVDGTCEFVRPDEAVNKLRPIFEDVSPDAVLTFGPEGLTGHSDHIAVSGWTTAAFERFAKPGARLFYPIVSAEWYEEFGQELSKYNVYEAGTPPVAPRAEIDLVFELTDDLLEQKLAALAAQTSQTEGMQSTLGLDFFHRALRHEMYRLAKTRS
ncbi:MAG: PIG-L family deacetylase [Actinomycetota bacterium]|nr:PIG-L family deacetylase [Actinomycetota bacterium]